MNELEFGPERRLRKERVGQRDDSLMRLMAPRDFIMARMIVTIIKKIIQFLISVVVQRQKANGHMIDRMHRRLTSHAAT